MLIINNKTNKEFQVEFEETGNNIVGKTKYVALTNTEGETFKTELTDKLAMELWHNFKMQTIY